MGISQAITLAAHPLRNRSLSTDVNNGIANRYSNRSPDANATIFGSGIARKVSRLIAISSAFSRLCATLPSGRRKRNHTTAAQHRAISAG